MWLVISEHAPSGLSYSEIQTFSGVLRRLLHILAGRYSFIQTAGHILTDSFPFFSLITLPAPPHKGRQSLMLCMRFSPPPSVLVAKKWRETLTSFWHRIIEWLGLEETCGDHLVQPRAGYTGLHPGRLCLSPQKRPQNYFPVSVLFQPQCKEDFLHIQLELPVPFAPTLSLGSTEKSLTPASWHLPLRYLYAPLRFPSVSSRLNRPSSLSFSW